MRQEGVHGRMLQASVSGGVREMSRVCIVGAYVRASDLHAPLVEKGVIASAVTGRVLSTDLVSSYISACGPFDRVTQFRRSAEITYPRFHSAW